MTRSRPSMPRNMQVLRWDWHPTERAHWYDSALPVLRRNRHYAADLYRLDCQPDRRVRSCLIVADAGAGRESEETLVIHVGDALTVLRTMADESVLSLVDRTHGQVKLFAFLDHGRVKFPASRAAGASSGAPSASGGSWRKPYLASKGAPPVGRTSMGCSRP